MEKYMITIEDTGETYLASSDANILEAMERSRCHGIPVGCRNGGCGACKIRIIEGLYENRKMSRAVLSQDEELNGCALACKVFPRSELKVQVLGRVWAHDREYHKTKSDGFNI